MLSVRGRAPTPFAFADDVPEASEDGAMEDDASDSASADSTSEDGVPEEDAPGDSAMEDSASEDDPPEYYPWEECGPADDTEDDNTPQPQHKGKEVDVVDPPKKITYIDLTGDAENCAHCADILGKGDGFAAHTFWFQRCGCVVCGHCMIDCLDDNVRWIDVDGQYNFSRRFSFCPKNTHFLRGKQVVLELFGTQCLICLGVTDDLPTRLRTPCGHAFCRRCLREWVVTNKKRNCPTCNYDFVKGRICDWANFQTVQRGVTCEREVEPG